MIGDVKHNLFHHQMQLLYVYSHSQSSTGSIHASQVHDDIKYCVCRKGQAVAASNQLAMLLALVTAPSM